MRFQLKRRKVLRTAGIATVLTGAALLLSGCWGGVLTFPGGKTLVIQRNNTAATILVCENENPGDVYGRAYCALDKIHTQCTNQPIPNWSQTDCNISTSPFKRDEMVDAIAKWLHRDYPCFANYVYPGSLYYVWSAIECPPGFNN